MVLSSLEKRCRKSGIKMTKPRVAILRALSESSDHPDVDCLHRRVKKIDPKVGMATVYRTVRLFEKQGIISRLEFGGGRARFEEMNHEHHDHLIDVKSGRIIEFENREIERLQKAVARKLGYTIIGHRLELFCVPARKK